MKLYDVYCDESRQTKDRYMVLAGIILDRSEVHSFEETMVGFRRETRMTAELKWGRVSNAKLPEYRRYIDYFFALNDTDRLHFVTMILDTAQFDHRTYNQGDRELGFYKFYYQLLLHGFGRYCTNPGSEAIHVFLDYRTSSYKLSELRRFLNIGMRKKTGKWNDVFLTVEPRDSKKTELLQMTDLLAGAIGYQKNGYHLLAGANSAKVALSEYIAKKAGCSDLCSDTPFRQQRFRIWNFLLRTREK